MNTPTTPGLGVLFNPPSPAETPVDPSARMRDPHELAREERKNRVLLRRQLAHITIDDMDRHLYAWRGNSLNKGTALEIRLNEEQIEALTKEFARLRAIVQSVEHALRDWDELAGQESTQEPR